MKYFGSLIILPITFKIDFTKYLQEKGWKCFDQHFSFKYFLHYALPERFHKSFQEAKLLASVIISGLPKIYLTPSKEGTFEMPCLYINFLELCCVLLERKCKFFLFGLQTKYKLHSNPN